MLDAGCGSEFWQSRFAVKAHRLIDAFDYDPDAVMILKKI